MLHQKFLLLISPITWKSTNQQIQFLAEKLSKDFNVFFLDMYFFPGIPIDEVFSSPLKRRKYWSFLNKLSSAPCSLIKSPYILTWKKYEFGEEYTLLDRYFCILQLWFYILISSKSFDLTVLAETSHSPTPIKFFAKFSR